MATKERRRARFTGRASGDWTKDADGEFVRWNEAPHYVDGLLNLVLPGERDLQPAELRKRRHEYLKLRWRDMRSN